MPAIDPQELGERIEILLDDLAARAGEPARAAGEELVRQLMQFYGGAIEQIVTIARSAGGENLVHRLAADTLVGAVFALHEVHPVSLHDRVKNAVTLAKRKLGSHGESVELLGLDGDGVVHVRVTGSGCGVATVKETVESAIADMAPDTAGVSVEKAESGPPLLQIGIRPGAGQ
jgi:Fe-S cluster biogenesis protein NfuA